jgi:hypothetical protein
MENEFSSDDTKATTWQSASNETNTYDLNGRRESKLRESKESTLEQHTATASGVYNIRLPQAWSEELMRVWRSSYKAKARSHNKNTAVRSTITLRCPNRNVLSKNSLARNPLTYWHHHLPTDSSTCTLHLLTANRSSHISNNVRNMSYPLFQSTCLPVSNRRFNIKASLYMKTYFPR